MVKSAAATKKQVALPRRRARKQTARWVVVALETLAAAEAASKALELALEAALLYVDTRSRRAAAVAIDDAANDAAVRLIVATREVSAAIAAEHATAAALQA